MRMPWEDDIDWGNTATTIVKGEPMSRRTTTIYGQMLLSEASLKRMTKAELIEYVLGLQDSYRISEECRELGAREAEKLLNERRNDDNME